MSYIENPKTKGSGIIACIPQKGLCPNKCEDCFFQSGRSYLEPLEHDRWARSYFARQASIRAIEYGVFVQWIHPAFTSITCSHCGTIDKQSRANRGKFICTSCSQEFHADINAARNIARKGQERIQKKSDSIKAL